MFGIVSAQRVVSGHTVSHPSEAGDESPSRRLVNRASWEWRKLRLHSSSRSAAGRAACSTLSRTQPSAKLTAVAAEPGRTRDTCPPPRRARNRFRRVPDVDGGLLKAGAQQRTIITLPAPRGPTPETPAGPVRPRRRGPRTPRARSARASRRPRSAPPGPPTRGAAGDGVSVSGNGNEGNGSGGAAYKAQALRRAAKRW